MRHGPTAPNLPDTAWQGARIALAAGACAAAAYVVTGTVWTAIQTYPRIIFWDMWKWIATLRTWFESGFTWSSLFALDAEHRIVVSRLLFFLDYLIDRQNGGFLLAVTLTEYFATVGVLVVLFRRAAKPEDADRIATLTFAAFAGAMLFAGSILEIIQFGYQVGYAWALLAIPIACLLAVLSVDAAKRGSKTKAAVWITLTILVCASATYSTGAGMPIWPLVFFIGCFSGMPRRHLAAIVVFAAICIGGYFIGYSPTDPESSPVAMLGREETYTLFLPLYLANPLAPEFYANAQHVSEHAWFIAFGWLGIFGFAGAIGIFVTSQLSHRPWQPAQLALFAILIYGVVIGLIIAFFRQNWGWNAALVDRYRTAPALFWIAGFMLLASTPWSSRVHKRAVLLTVGALMAIMMIVVASNQRSALRYYSDRHQRWLVTADALRVGVTDSQAFKSIALGIDPGLLSLIQFIRDHHLSVFSDGRFEFVGRPFDDSFRAASDTICKGEVDASIAIPHNLDAWRLSGAVWNVTERQSPQNILLVDTASNRIAGLGTGGLSLLDISGSPSRHFAKHDGWAGYVRASPGAAIAVYGVASDGKSACRVAVTRLAPAPSKLDAAPPGSAANLPAAHR
jgi:hypothetical protein